MAGGARAAGERGLLPVPVVVVEPFLGLGGRQDQFVGTEELHERRPVLPHLLPGLLDFVGIAVDQFGQLRRQFERGLRDVRGSGLAVGAHRPRGQPGVGDRADGDQAGADEPVLGQRAERGRARVGVRAVLQVIEQVQQDERVPVLAADLEDPLHRVAPAAQHLPVRRGEIGPTGEELVQYGLAVRQGVLKREPVDGVDGFAFVRYLVGAAFQHEPFHLPFEPRAEREADQGAFQFRAALDEGGEGRLVVVPGWKCHVIPPPRRARPACG